MAWLKSRSTFNIGDFAAEETKKGDTGATDNDQLDTRPKPNQFDAFIPWACREWGLSRTILVKHRIQEDYIPYAIRMAPKPKTKPRRLADDGAVSWSSTVQSKTVLAAKSAASIMKTTSSIPPKRAPSKKVDTSVIPFTALYDLRGKLIEGSVVDYRDTIPKQFIAAIKAAMPFHNMFRKLTLSKCILTQDVICEIGRLLVFSNITELCLDGNSVKEGNYFVLLSELSSLKILSLCRCRINDDVCAPIVKELEPGSKGEKLQSLSLSTNFITDVAAGFFGELLRKNRTLKHLNLADNLISNKGAMAMFNSLNVFELDEDELEKTNAKQKTYLLRKIKVYQKFLQDYPKTLRQQQTMTSTKKGKKREEERGKSDKRKSPAAQSGSGMIKSPAAQPGSGLMSTSKDYAYGMTQQLVGNFKDVFDANNTIRMNDKVYCIGNMNLCYLNLAYNDLDGAILKTIRKLLVYQSGLKKPYMQTGLISLRIEGNQMAGCEDEFRRVDQLMSQLLTVNINSSGPRSKRGF